ncbi:hypothetical protein [Streptomyces sp. NPDC050535]|uniref:hypothetical protein n=1 Tax=Streptomyces sp. NPDC050535 TaxID=3365626 RepID=UPI00378CEC14
MNDLPTIRRHRSWPSAASAWSIGLLNAPHESTTAIRAAPGAFRSRVNLGFASMFLTSSYRMTSDTSSPPGSVTRATGHLSLNGAHSGGA